MAAPSDNLAIVRRVYDCFNRHDWEGMAALYADPCEFKDPSFGTQPVWQTPAQVREKYAEMSALFPDLHDEVVATYPSGDQYVIVEFISSGTSPDGSKWALPICTIFTIEAGKIIGDYTYYDNPAPAE